MLIFVKCHGQHVCASRVIAEKIKYIHNNPVKEGLVYKPEDYVYSSASDYSGEEGILDNVIVAK